MMICLFYLQQVVLHHVSDDAVLVEVAAAPFDTSLLLEDDLCSKNRTAS